MKKLPFTLKSTLSFLPIFFFIAGISFNNVWAQEKPVFNYHYSKSDVKVGEEIELVIHGEVPPGWYIYSNDFDEDLGPIVASFDFSGSKGMDTVGKATPIGSLKKMDELWGGEVSFFPNRLEFHQKVKITDANVIIKGRMTYQMCSEETGLCVLHEDIFTFPELTITQ